MAGDYRFRPARPGDGAVVFEVTRRSVEGLSDRHYSPGQIAGWMGDRTAAFYEEMVGRQKMVVAERDGEIVGFVDAKPGEVMRLFVLPGVARTGLGGRLLAIGVEKARLDHEGPITLEATLNAEPFYRRHGFERVGTGLFSHGLGGAPIEVVRMVLRSTKADVDRAGAAGGEP